MNVYLAFSATIKSNDTICGQTCVDTWSLRPYVLVKCPFSSTFKFTVYYIYNLVSPFAIITSSTFLWRLSIRFSNMTVSHKNNLLISVESSKIHLPEYCKVFFYFYFTTVIALSSTKIFSEGSFYLLLWRIDLKSKT